MKRLWALRVLGTALAPLAGARAGALVISLLVATSGGSVTGCNVTSDGSTGDPPTEPDADVLGNGSRISEVVGPATWFNATDINSESCKIPTDRQVKLTGQVIVAVDRYDETGDGSLGNIYVQDVAPDGAAPPFSGMTIFGASFTPADLRLFQGDVVDTFGNFTEFVGPTSSPFGECKTLPEVSGAMTLRFDGAPPVPLTVIPAGAGAARWEPLKGYENARQYMGMLVRLETVTIGANPTISGGRFSAPFDMGGGLSGSDVIKISNELFDLESLGPPITAGSQFRAVTGVLTYFYGFKIAPRSAEDFEL